LKRNGSSGTGDQRSLAFDEYQGGEAVLARRLLSRADSQSRHVAVVDPRPQDYAGLLEDFAAAGMSCHFLRLGRDALRLARGDGADLWVVHVVLPDMSGLDLCAMLRDRRPESVVYMVADEYSEADERAARTGGASLFLSKPLVASFWT
jgi:DNA-binding response OmpR family regulator